MLSVIKDKLGIICVYVKEMLNNRNLNCLNPCV